MTCFDILGYSSSRFPQNTSNGTSSNLAFNWVSEVILSTSNNSLIEILVTFMLLCMDFVPNNVLYTPS